MKLQSNLQVKGKFIIKLFDANEVNEYHKAKKAKPIALYEIENLVVNVAKNQYAELIGDLDGSFAAANSGAINWLAVGTGLSSPAVTDTTLQTEIFRVQPQVPTPTVVDNVVNFDFFFAANEAVGTLKEVGAFIDATAAADSGVLFDRAQIDIEKTLLNSLLIQLVVTVV